MEELRVWIIVAWIALPTVMWRYSLLRFLKLLNQHSPGARSPSRYVATCL
jgi:hypothetical protein